MRTAPAWLLLAALTARPAAAAEPPRPVLAPPHGPALLPPLVLRTARRQVVVHRDTWGLIHEIAVDGETVYPPRCDAPPRPPYALCWRAHRNLRGGGGVGWVWGGHGKDLRLVEHRASASWIDLFLASTFQGSPECGAYGYWLMRVDASGVRAMPPVTGCFLTPTEEASDHDGRQPAIRWGSPLSFKAGEEAFWWQRYRLDEATFTWTKTATGKWGM